MRQGATLILGGISGHSTLQPVTGAALAPVMQIWVKRAEIIISIFVFPVELFFVFKFFSFMKHIFIIVTQVVTLSKSCYIVA